MRTRNYRIRQWAAAILGVATAVSGVSVLAAGTAQAATVTTGSVVASSSPTIVDNTANQPAGNLTVTINAGYTWVAGDTISLAVTDRTASASTVTFTTEPTVTPTSVTGNVPPTVTESAATGTNTLTLTFTNGGTANVAQPIVISSIAYTTTTAASGAVIITDTNIGTGTGTGTGTSFTTSSASNATVVGSPTLGLSTTSPAPSIGAGLSNQAAGNLAIGYAGRGTGWFKGTSYTLVAQNSSSNNCSTVANTLGFASVPTLTVTTANGQTTTPTATVSLGQSGACAGGSVSNDVVVTLTNSGMVNGSGALGATTQPVTFTLSGVAYNVSKGTPTGAVTVTLAGATPASVSNATVADVIVTGNNPAVGLNASAVNQPISNLVITEAQPAQIPTGNVCVTLGSGASFNSSTVTPTVTASGGGAVVGSTVTTGTKGAYLLFDVSTASSTAGATYTLSNINVNAGTTSGSVIATVTDGGSGTSCGATVVGTATAFNVVATARIYGQTSDGTAAALLAATKFPGGTTGCPGTSAAAFGVADRPVVLATSQNFPDALSAAYLAKQLGTGVLLTHTAVATATTLTALRQAGITSVYVVGGPLAVSTNVINQLKATPSYHCGGTLVRTSLLGTTQDLTVTQIYGQTEYGTSQAVAEYFPAADVGKVDIHGAYQSSSTSTPLYNDTKGSSGTLQGNVPAGTLRTAIVATGQTFPDAMAASALSYNQSLPILLTQQGSLAPEAQNAIVNLGIQQVIVMGGPIAISDNVLTQLEGMGVSVLRVAGQDYTDTARLLAQLELGSTTGNVGFGFQPAASGVQNLNFLVARGDFFADALSASAYAGINSLPILLTENPNTVGVYTTDFLIGSSKAIAPSGAISLTILGGPIAITPSTASVLEAAAGGA